MGRFQVIVGNIGTVYDGNSYSKATEDYLEYLDQSARQYGRAAGEDVTLMADGEIIHEHVGDRHEEE
jgi:hypothetical protein